MVVASRFPILRVAVHMMIPVGGHPTSTFGGDKKSQPLHVATVLAVVRYLSSTRCSSLFRGLLLKLRSRKGVPFSIKGLLGNLPL